MGIENKLERGVARLVVFEPTLDPGAEPKWDKYIGQLNTFSLVIDRSVDPNTYRLYAHDGVKEGGYLVVGDEGAPGAPGPGVTVILVPDNEWPPDPDPDPTNWYVRVAGAV